MNRISRSMPYSERETVIETSTVFKMHSTRPIIIAKMQ